MLIGSVSFSGSAIAFIKLQELITGRPITYPGQQVINALVGVAIAVMIVLALVTGNIVFVWIILGLSLVLGVIFVLPIGGADVPVLISLLNSFTGLAVAASGFVLDNALLIVAGTLVGASGIILTRLMSSAMGRSLPNILFSAFGAVITATGGEEGDAARPVRTGTPEDVGVLLAYARKVVIIPGLRPGGGPGPAHGARARGRTQGAWRRDLLRHPPGGGPHARPHERAAGRGQRPLRRA